MRILYGVQTTGRGHLTRARPMVAALKALGHDVRILFSGPPLDPEWLDPVFTPHTVRRGLTFVTRRGRISHLATMLQLRFGEMERDIYAFHTAGIDLIVTDYEPVTARIGWLRDIPTVGIGHLYAFAHRGVPVAGLNLFNRMVMKCFAPASIPLGLHWHHFDRPILPPTVSLEELNRPAGEGGGEDEGRIEGRGAGEDEGGHFLVYMPFESVAEVVGTLNSVRGHRFRFYCRVDAPREEGNVALRPLNRAAFVVDLRRCRGVIANTGFTFISEALHLGKKILTKPLTQQTEQESNALALKRLGMATVVRRLTPATVTTWAEQPNPPPANYPDVLAAVADWIHQGQWDNAEELSETLWSRVSAPTR